MVFAQNMPLLGKGQEIAQKPSDDPWCLGLAERQEGKDTAFEPGGFGPDPSSVPPQLHVLGWTPETHGVSTSLL